MFQPPLQPTSSLFYLLLTFFLRACLVVCVYRTNVALSLGPLFSLPRFWHRKEQPKLLLLVSSKGIRYTVVFACLSGCPLPCAVAGIGRVLKN